MKQSELMAYLALASATVALIVAAQKWVDAVAKLPR